MPQKACSKTHKCRFHLFSRTVQLFEESKVFFHYLLNFPLLTKFQLMSFKIENTINTFGLIFLNEKYSSEISLFDSIKERLAFDLDQNVPNFKVQQPVCLMLNVLNSFM